MWNVIKQPKMIKAIKLLLLIIKRLLVVVFFPVIAVWVLGSFAGVGLVLRGDGSPDAWLGVFSSLLILTVAVVVLGYHLIFERLQGVIMEEDSEDRQKLEAEELARFFHETYERLAPEFGYKTRKATSVPWADVPANNKRLMVAVCERILAKYFRGGDYE